MDPQAAKQQLVERVKEADNVLVTVSKDPSVDQLAAALGFTLMLNKMGKHASAVVSGAIPPAIQFLEPNKTFDNDIGSLRDFVISLSTEKADKLRYKKEDGVVKIFITPYKAALTQEDLTFTQGDFNVDVVVALGVQSREHLDEAIRAHGRILHDATVITINSEVASQLGAIDWTVPEASSLSEMLVSVSEAFQGGMLDAQMSTAFLTGIVAATDRFRNEHTSPKVMTMSAQLMAAGANQQLVASNLDQGVLSKDAAPASPPPADLPSVADEETVANEIDAVLNAAEQSASKDQPTEAQPEEPAAAPTEESESSIPDITLDGDTPDAAEAPAEEQPKAEAEPAATAEVASEAAESSAIPAPSSNDTLAELEKQLESLADQPEKLEKPTPVDPAAASIDLPDSDTLNVKEDASDALPIEESTIPDFGDSLDEAKLPTLDDIPPMTPPAVDQSTASMQSVPPQAPSQIPQLSDIPTGPIAGNSNPGNGAPRLDAPDPTLGGTFNATSDQAAEDKRREDELSINKAILSHNAPPTEQSNLSNQPVQFGSDQPPQISTNPRPVQPPELNLDDARRAVEQASAAAAPTVANNPIQSLNAQSIPEQPAMAAPPVMPPSMQQAPPPAPPPMGPPQMSPQPIANQVQSPANQFPLPPATQMPPQQPPGTPLAPPPPPPGGGAPNIAPKVSPSNLGSFAPVAQQQPQQQPPQPQFGAPPQGPPAPIQFDATPPPGNLPSGQRPY